MQFTKCDNIKILQLSNSHVSWYNFHFEFLKVSFIVVDSCKLCCILTVTLKTAFDERTLELGSLSTFEQFDKYNLYDF